MGTGVLQKFIKAIYKDKREMNRRIDFHTKAIYTVGLPVSPSLLPVALSRSSAMQSRPNERRPRFTLLRLVRRAAVRAPYATAMPRTISRPRVEPGFFTSFFFK